MQSSSLVRQLVRYRNVLVAIANASLTWAILIIAPLGLFAVITCTALVFLSSLLTGWVGDRALLALLNLNQQDLVQGTDNAVPLHATDLSKPERSLSPDKPHHQLPNR